MNIFTINPKYKHRYHYEYAKQPAVYGLFHRDAPPGRFPYATHDEQHDTGVCNYTTIKKDIQVKSYCLEKLSMLI